LDVRFVIITVATAVLIAVFTVSGLAKLRDHHATSRAAGALGVPSRLAHDIARALPVIELSIAATLAIGLVAAPVRRLGAASAVAMLGVFTAAMARTLRQGRAPVCNCFGSLGARPIGTDALIRNGALVALGVVVGFG
jgi:uncharacterized membrane protein YphA (DoxX/SURF4 family)